MADSVLPEAAVAGIAAPRVIPTKTWRVTLGDDDHAGRISMEEIDGIEAVGQAAMLALLTVRFKTLIFGPQYGSEIESIIAWDYAPQELVTSELQRTIRDTLSVDTRITQIGSIDVTFKDDCAYVTVPLETIYGDTSVTVPIQV